EETLDNFKQVRNARLAAYTLSLLAQIYLTQGDVAAARAQIDEAISIFKELGDRFGMTLALIAAGKVALAQGDLVSARASYRKCWEQACAIGALELIAGCLEGVGEVLVVQGEARSAVELWGKAAMIRADLIAPMPPVERIFYEKAMMIAREQLSDEDFQIAWMEGRKKSVSEFILEQ
ncbi:MAG: tetratricopeptide repeat protein, partial [Ktedonobacteraceae bacterium]|nr:tetratricopeptide repeat protein [Ktedonobacteraceae bacterium]